MVAFLPITDVPVEAFQWLGQPLDDVSVPGWAKAQANVQSPGSGTLEVTCHDGRTNARIGDWVVRYVDGSVDIIPDLRFRITYDVLAGEKAEAAAEKKAADDAARAEKQEVTNAKVRADAETKARVDAETRAKSDEAAKPKT